MADPVLITYIRLEGGEKVQKILKDIEGQGNKMAKSGGTWANTVTGLNQGYSLLKDILNTAMGPMKNWTQLAIADEASAIKRNTAVLAHVDATKDDIAALEAQATKFQRAWGVADDYTRSIQEQLAAQGMNTDEIDRGTRAVLGLSEVTGQDAVMASKQLTRFMLGLTDTVRGTTIKVDANADSQKRWQAVEKISAIGLQELTDKAHANEGTMKRGQQAWDEFKESLGRAFTSAPVMTEIDKLIGGLNRVTDWINKNQDGIAHFFALLFGNERAAEAATRRMQSAKTKQDEYERLVRETGKGRVEREISRKEISVKVLGQEQWGYTQGREINAMMNAPAVNQYGQPIDYNGNVVLSGWQRTQKAFGQQGLSSIAGATMSGGIGGGIGSALGIAGSAIGGPIGGLLGGLLGGGISKLFGGGKKRQGETPAQPIYTSDMNLARLVTDLLNITKMSLVRGASAGIDSSVKALNMQNARAGV